ncbi:MAG: hypothetical protein KJ721_01420 [Nanoarchaeota archaeon]|nr:hypothetical protein [Nanoarchaeota archaeon]
MNKTIPFYRGHERFEDVLANKELSRPGRAIRVYNYGGFSGDEKLYVIGTEGQLFDAQTGKRVEAKDVFSIEAAPDGWSVEGLELALLPDDEIKKILDNPKLVGL